MNTLNIPKIFANLDFYKENYLSILSNPEQYYTPVEQAYISVWPVGHQDLYLGDLLQLWFSEKWLINSDIEKITENYASGTKVPFQRHNDLYLYQLSGSVLSGNNNSKVWSVSEQQSITVALDSVFRYLCEYKAISRPPPCRASRGGGLAKRANSSTNNHTRRSSMSI